MRDTFVLNVLACVAGALVLGAAPTMTGAEPVELLLLAGGAFVSAGLLTFVRAALRTAE